MLQKLLTEPLAPEAAHGNTCYHMTTNISAKRNNVRMLFFIARAVHGMGKEEMKYIQNQLYI